MHEAMVVQASIVLTWRAGTLWCMSMTRCMHGHVLIGERYWCWCVLHDEQMHATSCWQLKLLEVMTGAHATIVSEDRLGSQTTLRYRAR